MTKQHRSDENKIVTISMSKELHAKIKKFCKANEKPFSLWVRDLVNSELAKTEGKKEDDPLAHFKRPAQRVGAGVSGLRLRK